MYQYLSAHPEIFLSGKKEPLFFAPDISRHKKVSDERTYLSLFEDAQDEKRVGEASVLYLYSECAADEIKVFSPSARILIMLRNPVDMMHSWHSERLYVGHEDIADFESALDAEAARKRGLRLPPESFSVKVFFYREIARFSTQIERYFKVFDREKIKIILMEDLKRDLEGVYAETLRFLDVDPTFKPDFPVVNPNKQPRNPFIQRFINEPPQFVRIIGKSILPSVETREALISRLRRLNRRHEARSPMRPELRRQLQKEFEPEVQKLSELLDRDLSHWSSE